jgi:hypothetical protein
MSVLVSDLEAAGYVEAEWAERIGAERVEELRGTLEMLRTSVFMADD